MTPNKEPEKRQLGTDYEFAERIINQTIAGMDDDTHIEYGSTLERNATPSKWRQWLHRLLRLHS